MKLKFTVTGMTCAACSARVEKVTRAVSGVENAEVNLLAGTMTVEAKEAAVADGIVRAVTDAGYGAYFGHGYGHSLGMEVHEAPSPNPSGERVMEANMIASAEPGIYLPGKFGVRIEDVVIFREDGCEDITKSPKNLIIV